MVAHCPGKFLNLFDTFATSHINGCGPLRSMADRGDELWQQVSYVQMSKNRMQVVRLLDESGTPLTPTELSERMAVAFNSASRAVRQLSDHGLVACLNPDAPRYRRYRLTETGRAVWETLQDLDAGRDRHNS